MRVLVLGGGYVGMYAALRLRRTPGLQVTLVSPEPYMTYQPFLPEATRLESAEGGRMVLSDGAAFEADTLVWTAGVRPHPVLASLGLPLDDRGRLVADEFLRVRDVPDAWTAGDCAAVPDLANGGHCAPTAQHAVRQAKRLAQNLVARMSGEPMTAYHHPNAGSVASLGLHQGVAEIYGVRMSGPLAWFLHRTYHVSRMPTFNRKVRIVADWTLALFFRRDIVSLGSLHSPRTAFERATRD